jgi:hypothetical protein
MVCQQLGVADVDKFIEERFCFVDSKGEKVEEPLPDGAYRVPDMPLFLTPPSKVEAGWMWKNINELLSLSKDIKHRKDVIKIIESIRVAANGSIAPDEHCTQE